MEDYNINKCRHNPIEHQTAPAFTFDMGVYHQAGQNQNRLKLISVSFLLKWTD
jgi:hypothetical protein